MSLAIDGVWKAGVWATTVWADGVWREGAPAEDATGGGRSKRRRQYPRWVQIEGRRFRVNSPEEERRLLMALMERARAVEATGTHPEVRAAARRVIKIQRRLKTVDDSEAQWLRRLQEMDEELLLFL